MTDTPTPIITNPAIDIPAAPAIRLQKYMADSGAGSRRYCETLIQAGRVTIDGVTIRELGMRVKPGQVVSLDNRVLHPAASRVVLKYHKPMGVITTSNDPHGRATVMDAFANYPMRLYPIGRLDYDSEGLLLLTNDGDLTHRLLHPSHEVGKTYIASILGELTGEAMLNLRRGVDIGGVTTAPADVRLISRDRHETIIAITIHEGRNRQIRRMCEAVGYTVAKLRRESFGPISLGDLAPGTWRNLTGEELSALDESISASLVTYSRPT